MPRSIRESLESQPLSGLVLDTGQRYGWIARDLAVLFGAQYPARPRESGDPDHKCSASGPRSRFRGNERIIVDSRYVSSITGLRSTPISGTATSTTSPGLSQTGGLRCTPAPVGVPVQMRSPGLSVAKVLM